MADYSSMLNILTRRRAARGAAKTPYEATPVSERPARRLMLQDFLEGSPFRGMKYPGSVAAHSDSLSEGLIPKLAAPNPSAALDDSTSQWLLEALVNNNPDAIQKLKGLEQLKESIKPEVNKPFNPSAALTDSTADNTLRALEGDQRAEDWLKRKERLSAEVGEAGKLSKKPTYEQALNGYEQATLGKAKISENATVTPEMAGDSILAQLLSAADVGKRISPEMREQLNAVYDRQLNYYQPFIDQYEAEQANKQIQKVHSRLNKMHPANKYPGRQMRDSDTGTTFWSDGETWHIIVPDE